jgi:hypothetical protein
MQIPSRIARVLTYCYDACMPPNYVYTIGYQHLLQSYLVELARELRAIVWDVRRAPSSRKPGWSRAALEQAMPNGKYAWKGDLLGGDRKTYDDEVAQVGKWPTPVLLLCLEEAPADCHRHKIANALETLLDVDIVRHIYRDEVVSGEELRRSIASGKGYESDPLSLFAPVAAKADYDGMTNESRIRSRTAPGVTRR